MVVLGLSLFKRVESGDILILGTSYAAGRALSHLETNPFRITVLIAPHVVCT